MQQLEVALKK